MSTFLNGLSSPFSSIFYSQTPIEQPDLHQLKNRLLNSKTDIRNEKEAIRHQLKMNQSNIELIHDFFSALISNAAHTDLEGTLGVLAEVFDFDLLIRLMKHKDPTFKSVEDSASHRAVFYRFKNELTLVDELKKEVRQLSSSVIYFIPHLIDLFIGAFSFLDARKKFTTLWEKNLLTGIVCNFFVIPYVIAQSLKPIFGTSVKVYAISGAIIFGVGILVTCYLKWLKPKPNQLIYCTNLEEYVRDKVQGTKVGQEIELAELCAALQTNVKVLLVGKSGEGKTGLVHHFIQEKLKGNLPADLNRLICFELNRELLQSGCNSFGYAEFLDQMDEQIDGYHEFIFIFLDNIQMLADSPAFSAFSTKYLEKDHRIRFVATTTYEGYYQKILKADYDSSFKARTAPILFPAERSITAQNQEIELFLKEEIKNHPEELTIDDEAIQKIIELSQTEDYLTNVGRPKKASNILEAAVIRWRISFNVIGSKDSVSAEDLQVQKIKAILENRLRFKDNYHKLAHLITRQKTKKESVLKAFLLHDYVAPLLESQLEKEMNLVPPERVKITAALVESAFKKIQNTDKILHKKKPEEKGDD